MSLHYKNPSQVYFMRPVGMPGPIKIGCSSVPLSRVEVLSVWSPFPLEIAVAISGSWALEQALHSVFAECHSHREWFFATPKLLRLIDALKSGTPIEEAVDLTASTGSIRLKQKRKEYTPQQRSRLSYMGKLRHARARQERAEGLVEDALSEPIDIVDFLGIYSGWKRDGHNLTQSEVGRLEEVIARPDLHMVERWPERAFPCSRLRPDIFGPAPAPSPSPDLARSAP